jgi:hypothetical protein
VANTLEGGAVEEPAGGGDVGREATLDEEHGQGNDHHVAKQPGRAQEDQAAGGGGGEEAEDVGGGDEPPAARRQAEGPGQDQADDDHQREGVEEGFEPPLGAAELEAEQVRHEVRGRRGPGVGQEHQGASVRVEPLIEVASHRRQRHRSSRLLGTGRPRCYVSRAHFVPVSPTVGRTGRVPAMEVPLLRLFA